MRRRTNIELDETRVRRIIRRYRLRTKKEAVDMALRYLAGQPMSREEALAMRGAGAIGAIPPDQGAAEWR
ncbi:MAG: type II toxin-antitoxin system VapB family antitoxin [Anaerolineae bacterium]|nr:type II toxin-antitoxin system VapB family antitoxin [Anaerolineae bacterium]